MIKKNNNLQPLPIYTTKGHAEAFLTYPYIFNIQGEWIGWVTPNREIYSVHGHYAGWLNNDQRILRKYGSGFSKPRLEPPPRPKRVMPPATFPLAPMMPELPIGTIDVLEESPESLPCVDFGDLREDMD